MTNVALNRVGSIAVVDLEAICELYGRYVLPYPLGRSRPVGSLWLLTRDTAPVGERLNNGDLRIFREWVEAYVRADISAECRVSYPSDEVPDIRLHAFRAGESGFIAAQRPDADVIDVVEISTVSPYDLGAVIAGSVALTKPGSRSQITVPGNTGYFAAPVDTFDPDDEDDEYGFTVRDTVRATPTATTVADGDVTATATVQSRCDPAREWGVDAAKKVLTWMQVKDDGDYISTPDSGYAVPMTEEMLRTRIDQLIAEDVAVLRRRRGRD